MLSLFLFSRRVQKVNYESLVDTVRNGVEEHVEHTMIAGGGLCDDDDDCV